MNVEQGGWSVPRLCRMPEVAAGTTEAVPATWSVAETPRVTATQPIATVETDKAAVDIDAGADATVLKVLVDEGATVPVGAPIAVLAEPGEVVHDLDALLAQLVGASPAPDSPARADAPTPRIFASPLARTRPAEARPALGATTAPGPPRRP